METLVVIAVILIFSCLILLSWLAGSDAPFMPTKAANLKKVFKIAGLKKGKVFYDLGSGDGRVAFTAASFKTTVIGIEQSILRILFSRLLASRMKLKNVSFFHDNLFSRKYSDANIIYIYLLPKPLKKLAEKFRKELKKGTIVISHKYPIDTWIAFKREGDFWLYRL